MGGTVTLENAKIGGMPRELYRQGTCGASVSVFMGGERNITKQAGLMRNFIYHMEGDKSTDIGKANWALMRAKTRNLKGFNLNQKDEYKKNDDDTGRKKEPLFLYKYKKGDVCYEDKVYVMGSNSLKQQFERFSQDGHRRGVQARVLPVLLVQLHFREN